MTRMLQDGIYHAPGHRPGRFFALLFLRLTSPEPNREAATDAIAELWSMYQDLKGGSLRDLDGVRLPAAENAMTVLLGFSPRLCKRFESSARPAGLRDELSFRAPSGDDSGGPVLRGSGLLYAAEASVDLTSSDLCVQVIAETKVATDQAVVETWKLLHDMAREGDGAAPLELVTFYLGFQRNDRRSWIDFHDGISNLRSADRASVITIGPDTDVEWAVGGTYLAFLRLSVDLAAWRTLERPGQELAVGRDKLTGCPITSVEDGRPVTDGRCPATGTEIWENVNDALFAEPPPVDDPALQRSHVQRANHHQLPPSNPASRRIFRQGYEFLEWAPTPPGFRAGLNFVSFQDTPERVTRMLVSENWLGRVNFGDGAPGGGLDSLISAHAAGVYCVPPAAMEDERFPGEGAFAALRTRQPA